MLSLYNSLTKSIQEFKPIKDNEVGVYSCGPTVYDYAHIGNLRSYIFVDLLRRVLVSRGFNVKLVMNVTDVDDKTIKRSQEEGKTLKEVTEFYTKVFLEDLARINMPQPSKLVKATEEIDAMVDLVKQLLEKDFAYKTANGDVYFDISKFDDYGKIAQVDLTHLKNNATGRLSNADEYEKEDVRDFALWKAYDDADGDVFWETELGKGRPGWHIECSAMSVKYLGQPFDIHLGGIDLLFPHHTNEIAQSQAASGNPLSNYWLHSEHLLVDNQKMAKSKNNFFTSEDVLAKGFDMLAFRYLVVSAHYRSKLNFTWEGLTSAKNALNNLYRQISVYDQATDGLPEYEAAFDAAIDEDMNTPKALAVMWDMINSDNDSSKKLASLLKFDLVLGLKMNEFWDAAKLVPDTVNELLKERDAARKSKDFSKSDELRQAIESAGYIVEDTPDGTILKKNV